MNTNQLRFFGSYDHESLLKDLSKARAKGTFEKYFSSGVKFYNNEALQRNRREQFIFVGNHISHFDYLLAATAFLDNLPEGKFPHIVAGTSLDVPFLPTILGFNYKTANLCWYDRCRPKDREYLRAWSNSVKTRLANSESFMFYPEGTRTFEINEPMAKVRGSLFFTQVMDARVNPLVATISVYYNHPIEEPLHDLIEWGRKKHKGIPSVISKGIYYASDAATFFLRPLVSDSGTFRYLRPWRKDTGKALLKIGEPKRLSEIIEGHDRKKNFKAIEDFIRSSVKNDYQELQRTA